MSEKIGRNDPCYCGSGKKYKNCCFQKEQQKGSAYSLGKRKFTAKVLSASGMKKQEQQSVEVKAPLDYAALMERSFGEALHSHEEKPPTPQNLSEYIEKEPSEETSQ